LPRDSACLASESFERRLRSIDASICPADMKVFTAPISVSIVATILNETLVVELARGIFTSVNDLARKIRRYIRHYNKAAQPIRWSYRNPAHRSSSTSGYTGH
jgi:hypothetical protein